MHYNFFILLFISFWILDVRPIACQSLSNGLIAHYLFNKDLKDVSSYQNHGQKKGDLQFDNDRFGNQCAALKFNGYNSYVEVPTSRSLESPTNALSVSVWFKLDQGATDLKWLTVCCKSNQSLETNTSPQFRMQATRVTLSINTAFTENLDADVAIGDWYHYTTVYDGNYVRAYLNGKAFFSFPYSGYFYPNKMPLDIGRDVPGALEYYSGTFDDLRIYNRALSAKEVRQIFNDDSERTSTKPPCKDVPPPVINITNPSSSPYTSKKTKYQLVAEIKNVKDKGDIMFLVNGLSNNNFDFNPRKGEFTSTIDLTPDQEVFCEIIAVNESGQDTDNITINYTVPKPTKRPPEVVITAPTLSPYNSTTNRQRITAEIKNVETKKGVTFNWNGVPNTSFQFNPTTKSFKAEIDLELGTNIFEIKATNSAGQDSESGIIRFAQRRKLPPEITILNPTPTPYDANDERQMIKAHITNIKNSKNIKFKWNGISNTNFTYDPSSQIFEGLVNLDKGSNLFEIEAINNDGQDNESGLIRLNSIPQPPVIRITNPTDKRHQTDNPQQNIKAVVEYINGKGDIEFQFNGLLSSNFTYNKNSKTFSTNEKLEEGFNSFKITATNNDGQDIEVGSIYYMPPSPPNGNVPPPVDLGEVKIEKEIEVKSPYIKLICYDHKKEDGDTVSVLINGEILVDKRELKAIGNGEIILVLPPFEKNKEYILVSKAWNLGKVPPNTMTIKIYDNGTFVQTVVLESEIGKSEGIRLVYRE